MATLAQLDALNACLLALGSAPVAAPPVPGAEGGDGKPSGGALWKPKNTLVKQVLRDMARKPLTEVQPK